MPDYEVTIPNQGTFQVSSDKELTDAEVYEYALAQVDADAPDESLSASEVAYGAVTNFPSSLAGVAKDIYTAITNPSDTLSGILKAVYGAGAAKDKLILGSMDSDIAEGVSKTLFDNQSTEESIQASSAIADFYAERYGSLEGLKKAVANDPASVMADAASVLYGGAGLGSKVGLPVKATEALAKTASYVDPIIGSAKVAGKVAQLPTTAAKYYAGPATGTGIQAIETAVESGRAGGSVGEAFVNAMRGDVPATKILEEAQKGLLNLKIVKNNQYKANQAALKLNTKILNFKGIERAIDAAQEIVSFKGKIVDKKGANAVAQVRKMVSDWKASDPKQYHTPEGIDALKREINSVLESLEFKEKKGRFAITGIKNAVTKEIKSQAPSYAKMMEEYSTMAGLVDELERVLKLGKQPTIDSAVRALQSSIKDTTGTKKALATTLDMGGDTNVVPMAAGSQFNQIAPRGLAAGATPVTSILSFLGGGLPLATANALISSPRVVGEAAYKAGQLSRGTQQLLGLIPDVNAGQGLNLAYQSQQPKEKQ